jgi:hypothetical protein
MILTPEEKRAPDVSAELTFSLPPEGVQEPAPQEQRERRKDRRKKVDFYILNDLFVKYLYIIRNSLIMNDK